MNTYSHHPLYPEIQPHQQGFLSLDMTHTMYWEESGNPNGVPVVFLHGGPGAGSSPAHRRFLIHHIIVLSFTIKEAQDIQHH